MKMHWNIVCKMVSIFSPPPVLTLISLSGIEISPVIWFGGGYQISSITLREIEVDSMTENQIPAVTKFQNPMEILGSDWSC